MGYRSQVECLIYGPADNMAALVARLALEGFEALTREDFQPALRRFDGLVNTYPDDAHPPVSQVWSFIHLSGDGWMWYDGYDDVDAWMRMLGYLDDIAADAGVNYEFTRAGEEHADVDERRAGGDVYGYLWTQTTVVISNDLPNPLKDSSHDPDPESSQPAAAQEPVLRDPAADHADAGGQVDPDRSDGHEGDHLQP